MISVTFLSGILQKYSLRAHFVIIELTAGVKDGYKKPAFRLIFLASDYLAHERCTGAGTCLASKGKV